MIQPTEIYFAREKLHKQLHYEDGLFLIKAPEENIGFNQEKPAMSGSCIENKKMKCQNTLQKWTFDI